MGKRIYVEGGKRPKPLVSNWPDLDCPLQVAKKQWRYIIFKGKDHKLSEKKTLAEVKELLWQWRFEKNLWLFKYEPTEEDLHDMRDKEKEAWRWEKCCTPHKPLDCDRG